MPIAPPAERDGGPDRRRVLGLASPARSSASARALGGPSGARGACASVARPRALRLPLRLHLHPATRARARAAGIAGAAAAARPPAVALALGLPSPTPVHPVGHAFVPSESSPRVASTAVAITSSATFGDVPFTAAGAVLELASVAAELVSIRALAPSATVGVLALVVPVLAAGGGALLAGVAISPIALVLLTVILPLPSPRGAVVVALPEPGVLAPSVVVARGPAELSRRVPIPAEGSTRMVAVVSAGSRRGASGRTVAVSARCGADHDQYLDLGCWSGVARRVPERAARITPGT